MLVIPLTRSNKDLGMMGDYCAGQVRGYRCLAFRPFFGWSSTAGARCFEHTHMRTHAREEHLKGSTTLGASSTVTLSLLDDTVGASLYV